VRRGNDRVRPQGQLRLEPAGTLLIYLLVLAGFWYAGISQNNSMAYLLCFFLFSIGVVSLLIGYRNVQGLQVRILGGGEGFADAPLPLRLSVANHSPRTTFGIRLDVGQGGVKESFASVEIDELQSDDQQTAETSIRLPRGLHPLHRVEVSSIFPLGLLRWKRVMNPGMELVVYPERCGGEPLPLRDTSGGASHSSVKTTGDDFCGWRDYREGDSSRHVDWKAVARGQPWLVKEFEGDADCEVALEWEQVGVTDQEQRLSQMARWIDECGRRQLAFSLRTPRLSLRRALGESHRREALRHLATWPQINPGDPQR